MHALTSCDTTSKVEIKASGLQAAIKEGQKRLFDFGRGELLENITAMTIFLDKVCIICNGVLNI